MLCVVFLWELRLLWSRLLFCFFPFLCGYCSGGWWYPHNKKITTIFYRTGLFAPVHLFLLHSAGWVGVHSVISISFSSGCLSFYFSSREQIVLSHRQNHSYSRLYPFQTSWSYKPSAPPSFPHPSPNVGMVLISCFHEIIWKCLHLLLLLFTFHCVSFVMWTVWGESASATHPADWSNFYRKSPCWIYLLNTSVHCLYATEPEVAIWLPCSF